MNFLEHISIIFEILHHFHTQKKIVPWRFSYIFFLQKSGCGWVLVVDGGMKAQRKICGAVKSGVRVFEHSNTTLVTGMDYTKLVISTYSVLILKKKFL